MTAMVRLNALLVVAILVRGSPEAVTVAARKRVTVALVAMQVVKSMVAVKKRVTVALAVIAVNRSTEVVKSRAMAALVATKEVVSKSMEAAVMGEAVNRSMAVTASRSTAAVVMGAERIASMKLVVSRAMEEVVAAMRVVMEAGAMGEAISRTAILCCSFLFPFSLVLFLHCDRSWRDCGHGLN